MARYMSDRSGETLFVDGSVESLQPDTSVVRAIWGTLRELERVSCLVSEEPVGATSVKSVTGDAAYHDTAQLASLEGEVETLVPHGQTRRRPSGAWPQQKQTGHYNHQTTTNNKLADAKNHQT